MLCLRVPREASSQETSVGMVFATLPTPSQFLTASGARVQGYGWDMGMLFQYVASVLILPAQQLSMESAKSFFGQYHVLQRFLVRKDPGLLLEKASLPFPHLSSSLFKTLCRDWVSPSPTVTTVQPFSSLQALVLAL